ncbi:hypothetical protein POSPLADRAFT_1047967 [Postia placenta MAD-698-R-SB12]|uniref:F-box domain-containing protein n=1 Tax=Postia placenta MAD-698-R-SB12 TaxID=670580 RepID=A0A1X6MW00_9APHY|nr:hypothetical protein POSPLADRAFT_1047967 [Postia placenta MAD-698-R-SB12]OSX60547.1 hypothetical protein POSPLADRAFT_1047967 [Postia placenta MAD-698-R-SB12]
MARDDGTSADPKVDEARSLLDQEITQLKQSIHHLSVRRNILAPVSRLPVEMLTEIFLQSADDESDPIRKYWRGVALQTAQLWTRIEVKNEAWVQRLLNLSKNLPVTACFDARFGFTPDNYQGGLLLAEHPGRLRGIRIIVAAPYETILCDLLKQIPAPALESIVWEDTHRSESQDPNSIASNLFKGNTPSLKRIDLHHCGWQWNCMLFRNSVTRLVLDRSFTPCNPSLLQLASALVRMPMLEYLELEDIQATPHHSAFPNPIPELCLSRLKFVRIIASTASCVSILSVLSVIHPEAQIELDCTLEDDYDTTHVWRLGYEIRGLCRRSTTTDEGTQYRSLMMLEQPDPDELCLYLYAWTASLATEVLPVSRSQCSLQICLRPGYMPFTYKAALIEDILSGEFPFENVESLHLAPPLTEPRLGMYNWAAIMLNTCQRLKELWLVGELTGCVLGALADLCELNGTEDGEFVLCPLPLQTLQLVTLEDVDFARSGQGEESARVQLFRMLVQHRTWGQGDVQVRLCLCHNVDIIGQEIQVWRNITVSDEIS